jgi:Fe-S-cluster containining protein
VTGRAIGIRGERQRRQAQRKALVQHGQAAIRDGLPKVPPKAMVLGLALLLRDCLRSRVHPNPASRAAELAHQVFAASLVQTPAKLAMACRQGCGYCCHNWVSATAPEIFLIVRHIRGLGVGAKSASAKGPADSWLTPAALTARAQPNIGIDIAGRFGAKLPCMFLRENTCSIYSVRPTACRQVTSTDLTACIEEYSGQGLGDDISVSRTVLDHARNSRLPLVAALIAAGLPSDAFELSAAVSRALEQQDSELRWLNGDDVFAGLATAPAEPSANLGVEQIIAAEIQSI